VWEHEIFEALPDVVRRIATFSRGHRKIAGVGWRVIQADELISERDIERWLLRDAFRRPARMKVIRRVRTTGKWPKPARSATMR
jgi:hypothetical protein